MNSKVYITICILFTFQKSMLFIKINVRAGDG